MQIATDLGRLASALEAQNTDADAEREQRDLDAQEDMAIWAQAMFWTALAQALLSAAGIVLIYITFRETRRAANSAEEIVDVTRRSAERQMRAYLSIRRVQIEDFKVGEYPKVTIDLRNTGQTPAKRISARIDMRRSNKWEDERASFQNPVHTSRLEIGGQCDTSQTLAADLIALTDDQEIGFMAGEWGYAVFGLITYRDVFGKLRRLTFRGHADHWGLKEPEKVQVFVSTKGVRST
ncbi:hypothetical protein [Brevundimonas sp.]|uniref:hypothetical protein n=1 Tax=Brevundimonas sp. TaxID=1871086 RepID=UPI0039E4A7B7